jgi:hypothetical protein
MSKENEAICFADNKKQAKKNKFIDKQPAV